MQSGGRLIGDSKLPVGENLSADGCSFLYVSPVVYWRLVQGIPHLRPMMLIEYAIEESADQIQDGETQLENNLATLFSEMQMIMHISESK